MYNIVWSVNIMCAILIVLVAIALVYIFKYDDWYPNDGAQPGNQDSNLGSESGSHDGSRKGAYT